MMFTPPGVTRVVDFARTLLLSGVFGAFLLGCSASGGSTGQGTGGTSNAGGNAATGGVTSAGGSSAVGGNMNMGGSAGTGGSVAEAGGSTGQGTGGTSNAGGNAAAGGATSTGGGSAAGGSMSTGGSARTGGSVAEGGSLASGGSMATSAGGAPASGGVATGGMRSIGGATGTGGLLATGGGFATGGITSAGGTKAAGGSVFTGGATTGGSSGGQVGSGGTSGAGGKTGSGGTTASGTGPCDIYAAGNTPCVAAHSTVRVLLGAYKGNLYQVRRASDNTTKDIGILTSGGFADSAVQDTFCAGTTCTISIIYDQSGKGNHLSKAPAGQRKSTPDNEANATALKLTASGHTVYGVHIVAGDGYRNDSTSGIATGDQPETEYMVTSGTFFNSGCCFDYGNAETNNTDDGAATMEAVYFGNSTSWGKGTGTGPWVMADLENGLFAGGDKGPTTTNTPLTSTYVTAIVIGKSGTFALKGGNAQSGTLTTMYDGARPNGYTTMKKQGAIILGMGGDNTDGAQGNFFEGCMTSGASSDASDSAVQANIVAAGYGS
ncbi:MAG: arabinofuranosidase catalytic domain-containing protein [Polyangia bacterium]